MRPEFSLLSSELFSSSVPESTLCLPYTDYTTRLGFLTLNNLVTFKTNVLDINWECRCTKSGIELKDTELRRELRMPDLKFSQHCRRRRFSGTLCCFDLANIYSSFVETYCLRLRGQASQEFCFVNYQSTHCDIPTDWNYEPRISLSKQTSAVLVGLSSTSSHLIQIIPQLQVHRHERQPWISLPLFFAATE